MKNVMLALSLMVSIPALADWNCIGLSSCSCGNGSTDGDFTARATGENRAETLSEARANSFSSCRASGNESRNGCAGYSCTCEINYTNGTCSEN